MKKTLFALACIAGPHHLAAAADNFPFQLLLERTSMAEEGELDVDILFVNNGGSDIPARLPPRLAGEIRTMGAVRQVQLELSEEANQIVVAPRSYARVSYRVAVPPEFAADTLLQLRLPDHSSNDLPFTASGRQIRTDAQAAGGPAMERPPSRTSSSPVANRFVAGLGPHEPVYAILGGSSDTNAKIQVSFRYRIFGEQGLLRNQNSWLDGFHFGFTQRMFWDLSSDSAPFRNIDFQPELIYVMEPRASGNGPRVGLQFGVRHESNGRDGEASRSLNAVYVQPTISRSLGDYDLVVGPRAWFYFGDQSGNRDIERFRGHTGLSLQIGATNGLKVGSFTRLNPSSGKGALQVDASYPLDRLLWNRMNLYLYGQLFTGYGESLLDYDRKATSARIGVSIIR